MPIQEDLKEVFRLIEKIQIEIGKDTTGGSNDNIQEKPEDFQPQERPENYTPEIKKFSISNSDFDGSEDEEEDKEDGSESVDENDIPKEKNIPKKIKTTKKKKAISKKSSKKKKVKKGKGKNKFNIFMKKKLKELKKKHPKKTHLERFKMAADTYGK